MRKHLPASQIMSYILQNCRNLTFLSQICQQYGPPQNRSIIFIVFIIQSSVNFINQQQLFIRNFFSLKNIQFMRADLKSPHNQPYQSQFTNHLTQNIHHSSQPLAKKRIGQYSYYPTHLIGSGYSSNVYKCKRRNDKSTTLAIKVIRLVNMSKGNFELLQNQINILKQIDHPHIIKFHEVYNTKNNCYIITDYCEGGTLQNYLESHSDINWQEICQQVVDACRYLADKLIIHRDIKPANIFLKNGKWTLGDFGFARFIPNKNSYIKEMYNVGSPLYMPPQTLEKNIYSLKTDSFALGILLFHLVTREFPWSGNSKRELLENYSKKSYPKEKIMHLDESVQKYLKGLCEIQIGRRVHIEQFYNLSLNLEKGLIEETETSSSEELMEVETNIKEKLNLNMAQKFKLCRFLSFIDINIQHFPQMCEISQSIRRNIKYFLILFGWDLKSPQAKYMEEFKCKNYQQFSSVNELIKFQAAIKEQIGNLEDSSIQRCQILRIKLEEYENILGNFIDGNFGKMGQEIDELILNPDFSRVSLKQTKSISEKMSASHF